MSWIRLLSCSDGGSVLLLALLWACVVLWEQTRSRIMTASYVPGLCACCDWRRKIWGTSCELLFCSDCIHPCPGNKREVKHHIWLPKLISNAWNLFSTNRFSFCVLLMKNSKRFSSLCWARPHPNIQSNWFPSPVPSNKTPNYNNSCGTHLNCFTWGHGSSPEMSLSGLLLELHQQTLSFGKVPRAQAPASEMHLHWRHSRVYSRPLTVGGIVVNRTIGRKGTSTEEPSGHSDGSPEIPKMGCARGTEFQKFSRQERRAELPVQQKIHAPELPKYSISYLS